MPTTYVRQKLKDENGNYIITPSMADMVYHNDGETVERKYSDLKNDFQRELDETNSQLSEVSDKVKLYDVQTVSEMKSKNLKVGDKIQLLNYYDGDNIYHKRVISSDDDGTGVLLNNGLYANLLHDGIINIKWLGITSSNNGSRDYVNQQSDFFNKLSQINKHSINKIEIPAGWYRFGKTLILPKTSTFTLEGQADTIKSVNFVSYTAEDEYLLSTDPSADINNQTWGGLTIKGIRFSGFRHLLNSGVKIHYAPWVKFDNVLIEGFSGHGLELGKIEDSEFNKLSIFQCGRSSNFTGIETETSDTDGDTTNSTHYALYLNNELVGNDASNMVRFIDCRIERNRSYPYVMSTGIGALWVNFYGLHSEIGSNKEVWGQDNIIFMKQNAGATTFTDCHIDNFKYQVEYSYGEIYASNCRFMSLKATGNGVKNLYIRVVNCNCPRLNLGNNDGFIEISNANIGEMSFGQTATKVMVSNSKINNINIGRAYDTVSYAYFTNCKIDNATFATDSKNISVQGGMIDNLSDGSVRSNINCQVGTYSGYNASQPSRVLSAYAQSLYNLASDVYPPYHAVEHSKTMAKGGVVWNTDFTTNEFAGWVFDPKTGTFRAFGPLV